jgi:nitrate reductase delta subunit
VSRRSRGTGPRAAEQQVVLQAASVLLQYPDSETRGLYQAVQQAVDDLPAGPTRDHLSGFLRHAAALPGQELEEHYVTVLDRKRRASLYLTWWTDGETRRRGISLARLKDTYRRHGAVLQAGELPDYLPVVLEFAATVDLSAGLHILSDHRPGLELLRLTLIELGTPYAAPVQAVCALLPGPSPADEAAARELARRGPPDETVGLAGYGAEPGSLPGGPGPTSLPPTHRRNPVPVTLVTDRVPPRTGATR